MKPNLCLLLLLLFTSASFASDLEIIFYYGNGCPHCARMEGMMEESIPETFGEYSFDVVPKEIYSNPENRQEMFNVYIRFGLDPGDPYKSGVPTTLVDNRSLIIGEISRERFEEIISDHLEDENLQGVYSENSFSPIEEKDIQIQITLVALIMAALADAVNPCTLAVMAMLLGVILLSHGRKTMLLSAATFISVIFICYLLLGLGIMAAIENEELRNIFFLVVTAGAFILAVLELNAYRNYKPGFFAIEMPMFMRPVLRKTMAKFGDVAGEAAEKYAGVIVIVLGTSAIAIVCSMFLLPCSAGPYLIALGMLSEAVTLRTLMYLVIYNIVFVLPMAVIAVAIYLGRTTVERIGATREKYIRQIHLFSGLILFLLFLIMLSQLLGVSITGY